MLGKGFMTHSLTVLISHRINLWWKAITSIKYLCTVSVIITMFYKMIIHISSVIQGFSIIMQIHTCIHCIYQITSMMLTQLLNLSLTTEAARLISPGAKPENYNK